MGRADCEKDEFYDKMSCEWDLQNPSEMTLGLRNFNGRIGGFKDVHSGYETPEMLREEDCMIFAMKMHYVGQTHGLKGGAEKSNIKYG